MDMASREWEDRNRNQSLSREPQEGRERRYASSELRGGWGSLRSRQHSGGYGRGSESGSERASGYEGYGAGYESHGYGRGTAVSDWGRGGGVPLRAGSFEQGSRFGGLGYGAQQGYGPSGSWSEHAGGDWDSNGNQGYEGPQGGYGAARGGYGQPQTGGYSRGAPGSMSEQGGYGDHVSRHEPGRHAQQGAASGYGDQGRQLGGAGGHSEPPSHAHGAYGAGHHDYDYQQWRDEQIRNLDNDYCSWRQDRYKKFADEFNSWRASRSGGQGQNTGIAPGTTGGGLGSSAAGASSTGNSGTSSSAQAGGTAGDVSDSGAEGTTPGPSSSGRPR